MFETVELSQVIYFVCYQKIQQVQYDILNQKTVALVHNKVLYCGKGCPSWMLFITFYVYMYFVDGTTVGQNKGG